MLIRQTQMRSTKISLKSQFTVAPATVCDLIYGHRERTHTYHHLHVPRRTHRTSTASRFSCRVSFSLFPPHLFSTSSYMGSSMFRYRSQAPHHWYPIDINIGIASRTIVDPRYILYLHFPPFHDIPYPNIGISIHPSPPPCLFPYASLPLPSTIIHRHLSIA